MSLLLQTEFSQSELQARIGERIFRADRRSSEKCLDLTNLGLIEFPIFIADNNHISKIRVIDLRYNKINKLPVKNWEFFNSLEYLLVDKELYNCLPFTDKTYSRMSDEDLSAIGKNSESSPWRVYKADIVGYLEQKTKTKQDTVNGRGKNSRPVSRATGDKRPSAENSALLTETGVIDAGRNKEGLFFRVFEAFFTLLLKIPGLSTSRDGSVDPRAVILSKMNLAQKAKVWESAFGPFPRPINEQHLSSYAALRRLSTQLSVTLAVLVNAVGSLVLWLLIGYFFNRLLHLTLGEMWEIKYNRVPLFFQTLWTVLGFTPMVVITLIDGAWSLWKPYYAMQQRETYGTAKWMTLKTLHVSKGWLYKYPTGELPEKTFKTFIIKGLLWAVFKFQLKDVPTHPLKHEMFPVAPFGSGTWYCLPINQVARHIIIFGNPGSGKSASFAMCYVRTAGELGSAVVMDIKAELYTHCAHKFTGDAAIRGQSELWHKLSALRYECKSLERLLLRIDEHGEESAGAARADTEQNLKRLLPELTDIENRYNEIAVERKSVYRFDFENSEFSDRILLGPMCRGDLEFAQTLAQSITGFRPGQKSGGGNSAFFEGSGADLLTALLLHLAETDINFTPNDIFGFIIENSGANSSGKKGHSFVDVLKFSPSKETREIIGGMPIKAPETFDGVLANMTRSIQSFKNPHVQRVLSPPTDEEIALGCRVFDPFFLRAKSTGVFIVVPEGKADQIGNVTGSIINVIGNVMRRTATEEEIDNFLNGHALRMSDEKTLSIIQTRTAEQKFQEFRDIYYSPIFDKMYESLISSKEDATVDKNFAAAVEDEIKKAFRTTNAPGFTQDELYRASLWELKRQYIKRNRLEEAVKNPCYCFNIIDEAGNVQLTQLRQDTGVGRGRKMPYILFYHNIAQIKTQFGQDYAESLQGTIGHRIFLPGLEGDTAKYASFILRRTTTLQQSGTDSRTDAFDSSRLQETGRDLRTEDEIRTLAEQYQAIAVSLSLDPMMIAFPPFQPVADPYVSHPVAFGSSSVPLTFTENLEAVINRVTSISSDSNFISPVGELSDGSLSGESSYPNSSENPEQAENPQQAEIVNADDAEDDNRDADGNITDTRAVAPGADAAEDTQTVYYPVASAALPVTADFSNNSEKAYKNFESADEDFDLADYDAAKDTADNESERAAAKISTVSQDTAAQTLYPQKITHSAEHDFDSSSESFEDFDLIDDFHRQIISDSNVTTAGANDAGANDAVENFPVSKIDPPELNAPEQSRAAIADTPLFVEERGGKDDYLVSVMAISTGTASVNPLLTANSANMLSGANLAAKFEDDPDYSWNGVNDLTGKSPVAESASDIPLLPAADSSPKPQTIGAEIESRPAARLSSDDNSPNAENTRSGNIQTENKQSGNMQTDKIDDTAAEIAPKNKRFPVPGNRLRI